MVLEKLAQITSGEVVHDQIQTVSVLEGGAQLDQPFAVGLGHDVALGAGEGVVLLGLGGPVGGGFFGDTFDGVEAVVRYLAHQDHVAKRAVVDFLQGDVIVATFPSPQRAEVFVGATACFGPASVGGGFAGEDSDSFIQVGLPSFCVSTSYYEGTRTCLG